MVKGLIGKKLEMGQVFDSHGRVVPVTKLLVEPNFVVQIKDLDKDDYKAAQIGSIQSKHFTKPRSGHVKKAGLQFTPKVLVEVVYEGELEPGQEIQVDQVFRKGSLVDVVGTSKGKGFAGVVKRWGFSGGPRTHGQSDRERAPGSIGATTTPGRVYKGMKMAGHMGVDRVTIQGLEIIEVDKEKNELWVKGSVPGSRGSDLLIKKSEKKKKAYHEQEVPAIPVVAGGKEEEAPEAEKPATTESTEEKVEDTGKPATTETQRVEEARGG